ncbi:MAG: ATP-binding protein [Coprobacillus sp.]
MDELALNILDIAYNSIRANASLIQIHIEDSCVNNLISIDIIDNGYGMTKKQVDKVIDPFYTTRTTRSVGLGIPLFKQNAELTGGMFSIDSEVNVGTHVKAEFVKDNIDTPMMGDIVDTIATLIQANENIDYEFIYKSDDISFEMNTKDMKDILGEVKINEPEVILWLKEYIKEGLGK